MYVNKRNVMHDQTQQCDNVSDIGLIKKNGNK